MDFTFLGTSSGIPTRYRNVSALALRLENSKHWTLVDCGEATQHRLLRTRYSLASLAAICITHVHGDHCFGLPGLLASASMAGRQEPLVVIGPQPIEEFIERSLDLTDSHLSFSVHFIDVEQMREPREIGDVIIQAWPLSHRVPSYGYSLGEARVEHTLDTNKLLADGIAPGPAWGELARNRAVRLENGGMLLPDDYLLRERAPRKIVVGGDNDTPSLLRTACQNANVLIHEATYTQAVADKVGSAPRHSSAATVARFAEEIAIENLVLTHFSARYHGTNDKGEALVCELEREARSWYRGNLHMASDLTTYRLQKDGSVTPND